LNNLFSTGATVSAYINTASLGGGSLGRIMDKSGTGWILYTQNSFISGQYQIQFEQAFTNNRTNKWQTGHIITTSTWAHVAISYSSSSQSNIPGFYINGVAQSITDVSTGSGGLDETPLNDFASNLMIGNRADAARPFGGRIDDVRIYSRALSAAEVFGLATLPTGDRAPSVNAGTNQITYVGLPILLAGTATDDGLPNPPGMLTTTWSLVSGPGNATFGNSNALSTTASFDTAGTYVLQLVANDSQAQTVSDVTITVLTPTPFQSWQLQYFQCVDCPRSVANADPLGKGMSNFNQFLAGINPTNPASAFRITSVARQGSDVLVIWTTVGGLSYVVQDSATGGYSSNSFVDISPLISIPGTGESTTNYLDAGAVTNGPGRYYRVRLGP
jgi:hypothetical protein